MKQVKFVEMTDKEFKDYLDLAIQSYADDKIRAGNYPPESGLEDARKEFAHYLPEGRFTKGQHIFSVVDDESRARVGMIWFATNMEEVPDSAFIYDIRIDDRYQNQGLGTASLLALETKVKELGKRKILLHVFAHNVGAKKLYEKLGYDTTNIMMAKELN
jgi:ribosomal protein S18 acetylase RimI-like enzyme